MSLEISSGLVVSAGVDGWVRYWNIGSIVDADIDADTSLDFNLEPACEIQLDEPSKCSICWMLRGDNNSCQFFVRDLNGKLWKLPAPEANPEQAPATCLAT
jgi:hypothetical protein